MADVAGRLTSYPGVCLATLGPGATNLLTGVADATLDGAPLVALTGQAGLERIHKRSHQYAAVLAFFAPAVKWGARIELPDSAPEVIRTAFRMARLERPGATHVEIPEDVAERETDGGPIPVRRTRYAAARDDAVEAAAKAINEAVRPIVLVGNGVIRRDVAGHGAVAALRAFVAQTHLPTTHTFMTKGALDDRGPSSLPAVGLQRPGPGLAALSGVRTEHGDRREWIRADGYRAARRDRREAREARTEGRRVLGRRRVPDERAGARDREAPRGVDRVRRARRRTVRGHRSQSSSSFWQDRRRRVRQSRPGAARPRLRDPRRVGRKRCRAVTGAPSRARRRWAGARRGAHRSAREREARGHALAQSL